MIFYLFVYMYIMLTYGIACTITFHVLFDPENNGWVTKKSRMVRLGYLLMAIAAPISLPAYALYVYFK